MQGTIEKVQDAKSGKSLQVTVNGQRFYTKNWAMRNLTGRTINFEPEHQAFSDGGGIDWINNFTEVQAGGYSHTDPGPAHAGAYESHPQDMSGPHGGPPPYHDESSYGTSKPQRDLGPYLPFTSNMCAHLIQAGHIKTADDLRNWADNSMAAIIHAVYPTFRHPMNLANRMRLSMHPPINLCRHFHLSNVVVSQRHPVTRLHPVPYQGTIGIRVVEAKGLSEF